MTGATSILSASFGLETVLGPLNVYILPILYNKPILQNEN